MSLSDLPMSILEDILSYNMIPWSIATCRRLYDAEENLHTYRLSLIEKYELHQLVRWYRWEDVVYVVHMTDDYTDHIDTIYYIMDSGRYMTGKVLIERLIPHIGKEIRQTLLQNLLIYDDVDSLCILIPHLYKNIYDLDAKMIVRHGSIDLIYTLIDKYRWCSKGISYYACKYGKLDIYTLSRSYYKDRDDRYSTYYMLLLASDNDHLNIIEWIVRHEVSESEIEGILSKVYTHTWSPASRSYLDDRGRDDSVLSTISTCSTHTSSIEVIYEYERH